MALLHVSKKGYHKLPGGGIDEGEDIYEALSREAKEEAGVEIEIFAEVGRIVEYWDQNQQLQTSDCYAARQLGEQGTNALTNEEVEQGFQIVWAKDIDTAIAHVQADQSDTYDGSHIKPRDLLFLQTAKLQLGL